MRAIAIELYSIENSKIIAIENVNAKEKNMILLMKASLIVIHTEIDWVNKNEFTLSFSFRRYSFYIYFSLPNERISLIPEHASDMKLSSMPEFTESSL